MKLDALTVAALAVAGLAVATFARSRASAAAGSTSTSTVDQVYGQARAQRQDSGAAIAQNLEYMRYWDNPMASTFYSSGSLGD